MTGAIILIVIAVALLPELLTGAGSKGRLAMDDGRAADGPPLVSYKIDLTGNAPRPATAERDAAPLAPAEATPAPPVAATPAPAPASPPTTAPATSVATAPAPAATAPMPPAAAPAAAPTTPTTAAPAHAEPAKSETKLVVQVGSFRDRKAADVRANLLRARSFEVTVTPNGADPVMYRVRVGPAGDRVAAEKLVKRLKVVKVDGSIVPAS